MNVTYEKIDELNGKVSIVLEEKDYADEVKKQLKQIAKTRQEPGFRVGHVPMAMVEKKYGKAVKFDVINRLVADKLYDYIKEQDFATLGQPVPLTKADFDLAQKDFTFEFQLALAPVIDLKVDKDIHVPYYNIQVSEEMIDEQDKNLRRRMGKQEPGPEVNEDALVKGVITELNEDGTVKEGGVVMENGIVAPKYFKNEEQTKLFMGKHPGDKVVFNPWETAAGNPNELMSMLGIPKDETENHKGNFDFDIKEIIVLVPAELNQEYFDALFGEDKVHNEEEYRSHLKEMIATQLKADSNYRFTIDARKVLEEKVGKLELPVETLKKTLMIQNEGVTEENVEEVYKEASSGLEWQLIADHIAKQFELKIDEEDLNEVAAIMARNEFAKYGMTNATDEMVKRFSEDMLKDDKTRRSIANDAFEMKLFHTINENVTLDEKDVTVDEFKALFEAK